jgi:hypothetical protein
MATMLPTHEAACNSILDAGAKIRIGERSVVAGTIAGRGGTGIISRAGEIMENLDPFCYGMLLIFMLVGPICAALTLIAGVVGLVRRSKRSLIFALFLLLCTVVAGITFVIAYSRAQLR